MGNEEAGQDLVAQLTRVPTGPTAQDAKSATAAQESQQAMVASNALSAAVDAAKKPAATAPTVPVAQRQNPTNQGNGTFGDKLSASLRDARDNADATMMQQPGAFSKLFVGSVMDALAQGPQSAQQTAGPSTAAIAKDAVPTSGPGSVGYSADRTIASTPMQQAPRKQFGQHIWDQIGDMAGGGGMADMAHNQSVRLREEAKDRQQLATSNAEMMHQQAETHKYGEEAMKQNIADGSEQVRMMTTAPPNGGKAGTEDAKDKTSDELTSMIKKGEFHPTTQTAFPTGKRFIGNDKNGLPMYQTTYSIVTPPREMYITKDMAKFVNEHNPQSVPLPETDDVTKQQRMSGVDGNAMIQRANNAKTVSRALEVEDAKNQKDIDAAQTSVAARNIKANPVMIQALNSHNASTPAHDGVPEYVDLYAGLKAYDYLLNNTDIPNNPMNDPANRHAWIDAMGGEPEVARKREDMAKIQAETRKLGQGMLQEFITDPTKLSNNTSVAIAAADQIIKDPKSSVPQIQQAQLIKERAKATAELETQLTGARIISKEDIKDEIAKKRLQANNPNNLEGEAFIKTLPIGRQNTLRSFLNGTVMVETKRLEGSDKGRAYLDDILSAFPLIDLSKAPAYYKMRSNFASGPEAKIVQSSRTIFHHFDRMMDALDAGATAGLTGKTEAGLGMNQAGRQLENDALAMAHELTTFYVGGVGAEGEQEKWLKKLNPYAPGMTNQKLKDNLKEFAGLVGGKLEAMQTQWDENLPSSTIKAPRAVMNESGVRTYKRLTGKDLNVHNTEYGDKDTIQDRMDAGDGPPAPTKPPEPGEQKPKVGGTFKQNGIQYTIDSIDKNGVVTGAH